MGCRQSTVISPMERMAFEYILTHIPIQCQQQIIDLPIRKFLDIYQKHLDAENHLREEEYLAAITWECQAIQSLEVLLHPHVDNFIFADMHKLLSICYWNMGNVHSALIGGLIALMIRLKHTPADCTEISLQYSRLVLPYLLQDKYKQAEECLEKAIMIGRLSIDLPHTYIQELEESLAFLREKINARSRENPVIHYFTSMPGENVEQFLRRTTDDVLSIVAERGPIEIDKSEYERLPDKELESQVTDEIFNEILQILENYIKEDRFLCEFGTKGARISFIAAYFKATQMKTSALSPAMIEAALTLIINQINQTSSTDDERIKGLKQSPFIISYTDEDPSRMKGVRVFEIKGKNPSET